MKRRELFTGIVGKPSFEPAAFDTVYKATRGIPPHRSM